MIRGWEIRTAHGGGASAIALVSRVATVRDHAGKAEPCVVARIVDGDTLCCAEGRRLRLLTIDRVAGWPTCTPRTAPSRTSRGRGRGGPFPSSSR
jgi:endonuclease YncB( thermonuclease family)